MRNETERPEDSGDHAVVPEHHDNILLNWAILIVALTAIILAGVYLPEWL